MQGTNLGWSLRLLYEVSKGKHWQPKAFRWDSEDFVLNKISQGDWFDNIGVGNLLIRWAAADTA